jgi:P27 family predicted phage terminase small subunit
MGDIRPKQTSFESSGLVRMGDRARAVFEYVVPRLSELGILNSLDTFKISRYCETLVRWQECSEFLDKHGSVYPMKNRAGMVICMMPWPHAKLLISFGRALDQMERELGMSPASRANFAAVLNGLNFRDPINSDPFSDCED